MFLQEFPMYLKCEFLNAIRNHLCHGSQTWSKVLDKSDQVLHDLDDLSDSDVVQDTLTVL